MPLSIEKCGVLHCEPHQPRNFYLLCGYVLPTVDTFVDLGVVRTSDGGYVSHCQMVASKAAKMSGAIRHVFRSANKELLRTAFRCYIIPILMYCLQVWCPSLRRDIELIEKVQRRFTKRICGLQHLSYHERLQSLGALSLQHLRTYLDLITLYKLLHNNTATCFGLSLATARTRGGGIRLQQLRARTRNASALFNCRVPTIWNSLPLNLISTMSLLVFKRNLFKYLYNCN